MHEDRFFKFTVQESGLNINLMDFEIVGCSKRQEKTDRVGFCNGGKCFGKVNARFLSETLRDESSLITRDFTNSSGPINTLMKAS